MGGQQSLCQSLSRAGARAGLGGSPSLGPHLGKHPDNPQLWESPEKGDHTVLIRDLGVVPGHLGQVSMFKLEREEGKYAGSRYYFL